MLREFTKSNWKFAKWSIVISSFKIKIFYKNGKENKIADSLSRKFIYNIIDIDDKEIKNLILI